MIVRFDDSLAILVNVIRSALGEDALQAGTVLRNAVGRLTFFAAQTLREEVVEEVSNQLRVALGAYASPDRVVVSAGDYGADMIRADPLALPVSAGGVSVRLVDRRLVGADWLHAPVRWPRRRHVSCSPA